MSETLVKAKREIPTNRRYTTLYAPKDQLAAIDKLAKAHKLSRTQYMIRASLGTLHENHEPARARLDDHEIRLSRIERRLGI